MRPLRRPLLPSAQQQLKWISQIVSFGIRRPGTLADQKSAAWVVKKLLQSGCDDFQMQRVPARLWVSEDGDNGKAALEVWRRGDGGNPLRLPCFPLPYSRAPGNGLVGSKKSGLGAGVEAELCLVDEKRGKGWDGARGKLAVVLHNMVELPSGYSEVLSSKAYGSQEHLDASSRMMPYSSQMMKVDSDATKAGAAGYIGILANLPWDSPDYFLPYDAHDRPLPGAWLSPKQGAKLLECLETSSCTGRLHYEGHTEEVVSYNIQGTMLGSSSSADSHVLVGTHHDGPWASAVQDASGMAMVLAQAQAVGQIPREERGPHNTTFFFIAAHMAGNAGAKLFPAHNPDLMRKAVAHIHLEHASAAPRCTDQVLLVAVTAGATLELKLGEQKLTASEHSMPHWWFVSRSRPLEKIVDSALTEVGSAVEPSLLMAADALQRVTGHAMPPGDGAFVEAAGVPVVQHLNAPAYLFHREDSPRMVHAGALEGMGGVAALVLDALQGVTREQLEQGRYELSDEDKRARGERARAVEEAHGIKFRGFKAKA